MKIRIESSLVAALLLLASVSVYAEDTASPVNFDNVAPADYRTMFKMYMASQYDLLDDPEIALEYHTLFRMPRYQANGQAGRSECVALWNELNDEFGGSDVTERFRPPLREALGEAKSWPKTGLMKITATAKLKSYDQSRQAFPLSLAIHDAGRQVVDIATHPVMRPEDACLVRDPRHQAAALLPRAGNRGRVGFVIEYHGIGGFSHLAMSPAQGRAYINAHTGREVNVEIIVRTESVEIKNNRTLHVRAQVVAARLLDPDNNRVLYVFTPTEAKDQTLLSEVESGDAVPLTNYMITLHTLRDNPHYIDEEWVMEAVAGQIRGEQMRWQHLDKARERNSREFVYEWQKLEKEDPELANGALMDVFVRPERRWEFVRAQPQWDDRLATPLIEVFLFERAQIEGRNPDFAARELLPVWRRHLRAATRRLPERLSIEFQVDEPAYNYDAGYFDLGVGHFAKPGQVSKLPIEPVSDPRFSVPPDREITEAGIVVHPDAARNGVLYGISRLYAWSNSDTFNPVEIKYRYMAAPLHGADGPEMWRTGLRLFTSSGNSTPRAGGPIGFHYAETMVLDRWLKPIIIEASPQEAEQLMARMHVNERNAIGDGRIKIRLVIRPDHVELAPRFKRRRATVKQEVLFAELESVSVRTILDDVVVEFSADHFPSATSMAAASARDEEVASPKVEEQDAKQGIVVTNPQVTNQRSTIEMRFALCQAMPGPGNQSRCYDGMLNEQAELQLSTQDLQKLRELRGQGESQRTTQDHWAATAKRMEPYLKCQALADPAAMQQCWVDLQNERAAILERCMAITDRQQRNECLSGQ
jgi:hypothetical protein